jgi:hypothetical protein
MHGVSQPHFYPCRYRPSPFHLSFDPGFFCITICTSFILLSACISFSAVGLQFFFSVRFFCISGVFMSSTPDRYVFTAPVLRTPYIDTERGVRKTRYVFRTRRRSLQTRYGFRTRRKSLRSRRIFIQNSASRPTFIQPYGC